VAIDRAMRRESELEAKAITAMRIAPVSLTGTASAPIGVRQGRIVVSPATGEPAGQVRGRVVDSSGAVMPGVTITLLVGGASMSAVTGGDGTFLLRGVPPGVVTASAHLDGFRPQQSQFTLSGGARRLDVVMEAGGLQETVTVAGVTPVVDTQVASQNVVNLQRRAAGVLPIRVDVPRTGSSHRFSRPIVVDDETTVRFRYARR
jgi:hypothetical protein